MTDNENERFKDEKFKSGRCRGTEEEMYEKLRKQKVNTNPAWFYHDCRAIDVYGSAGQGIRG